MPEVQPRSFRERSDSQARFAWCARKKPDYVRYGGLPDCHKIIE